MNLIHRRQQPPLFKREIVRFAEVGSELQRKIRGPPHPPSKEKRRLRVGLLQSHCFVARSAADVFFPTVDSSIPLSIASPARAMMADDSWCQENNGHFCSSVRHCKTTQLTEPPDETVFLGVFSLRFDENSVRRRGSCRSGSSSSTYAHVRAKSGPMSRPPPTRVQGDPSDDRPTLRRWLAS